MGAPNVGKSAFSFACTNKLFETERINMFPDNWTNIKSKNMTERRRYFMMGNALVVGIIERLGEYLEEIFDKEE